ncbi:recombinase family protein [Sphingorhabdus soli]|uniref:Recombinase family protein n=1 Tax=Flavisphingopyxis soli TaxID=2601267 RepID=A0A5C6UNQ7_9SPHN|nr:recombinase family protein [Sphingorhabdus soli]TXC73751.1 recombinase family protein [Sphingorhabdus soli]
MPGTDPTRRRCAIYTRKSTEDGLEQEFNSLDAQRAACAAYIESQRHEGWTLVPEHYDDGGYSGGNMERPGLSHIMVDIRAGKIDVIVVYKVDRLTRSLADFARIIEILDDNDASFVSVTQAFNTTSSMGRLTLNVLLSFAQFEREITSERIRDKIAASKARGMWMGGVVPLGYVVEDRHLVVDQRQAVTVRNIFTRYLTLGSVSALAMQLEERGVKSPQRRSRGGRISGDVPFSRGALYTILKNRTYLGEVAHKGKSYCGEHDAIMDRQAFEAAAELLSQNRANTINGLNADHPSPLAGMIYDASGSRMLADHACKRGKRYRYYASANGNKRQKLRVPAGDLEGIVLAQLRKRYPDAKGENANLPLTRRAVLDRVEKVIVSKVGLEIQFLDEDAFGNRSQKVEVQLARRGKEVKLVEPPQNASIVHRDRSLIKLVVKAYMARHALENNEGASLAELAQAKGLSSNYFRVLLRISYLAPDIMTAIVEGRQPVHLNRQKLARATGLPTEWQDQRKALGF